MCWSSSGDGDQVRWKPLYQSAAISWSIERIVTPKKAWNGSVANTMSIRKG